MLQLENVSEMRGSRVWLHPKDSAVDMVVAAVERGWERSGIPREVPEVSQGASESDHFLFLLEVNLLIV